MLTLYLPSHYMLADKQAERVQSHEAPVSFQNKSATAPILHTSCHSDPLRKMLHTNAEALQVCVSACVPLTVQVSLGGMARILSPVWMKPASIFPVTQKPEPWSGERNPAVNQWILTMQTRELRNKKGNLLCRGFFLPLNTSDTHSLKGLSTDLCGGLKASVQRDDGKKSGSKRGRWLWV